MEQPDCPVFLRFLDLDVAQARLTREGYTKWVAAGRPENLGDYMLLDQFLPTPGGGNNQCRNLRGWFASPCPLANDVGTVIGAGIYLGTQLSSDTEPAGICSLLRDFMYEDRTGRKPTGRDMDRYCQCVVHKGPTLRALAKDIGRGIMGKLQRKQRTPAPTGAGATPFFLRNGVAIHNTDQLLAASETNWDDVSHHLQDGHLEPWLEYTGRHGLAEQVRQIRQLPRHKVRDAFTKILREQQ